MKCPYCYAESYVIQGNCTEDKRKRKCQACGRTFWTIEVYEHHPGYLLKAHQLRVRMTQILQEEGHETHSNPD